MSKIVMRFRPVIFRDNGAVEVCYLYAGNDGHAVLRTFDWPVPLAVPLEEVAVAHLPPTYRPVGLTVVIGPPEQVIASSGRDAHHRLMARLAELRAEAARGANVTAPRT